MAPEGSPKGEVQTAVDEQLWFLNDFIEENLGEDTALVAQDSEGDWREVRSREVTVPSGATIFLESSLVLQGKEDSVSTHSISTSTIDGKRYYLIFKPISVAFGSGGQEVIDMEDYKDKARDLPEFQEVVDKLYKIITGTAKEKVEERFEPLSRSKIVIDRAYNPDEPVQLFTGMAEHQVDGTDATLLDHANRVYGVFGGVGSGEPAPKAARLSAEFIQATLEGQIPSDLEQAAAMLVATLARTHKNITDQRENTKIDSASAAIVWVVEQDGHLYGVWASVGNCRLYGLFSNQLEQISEDDITHSVVTNALGYPAFQAENIHSGYFEVKHRTELLLITGGVIDDSGNDDLEPNKILEILDNEYDAAEAAKKLLEASQKVGDKTAVIIRC